MNTQHDCKVEHRFVGLRCEGCRRDVSPFEHSSKGGRCAECGGEVVAVVEHTIHCPAQLEAVTARVKIEGV